MNFIKKGRITGRKYTKSSEKREKKAEKWEKEAKSSEIRVKMRKSQEKTKKGPVKMAPFWDIKVETLDKYRVYE